MKKVVVALVALLFFALPALADDISGELYYISAPGCGSCAKMKAVLDDLNAPNLTIHEVGIFDDLDQANALFAQYSVPEDQRAAPMLLFGDRIVTDVEDAKANLSTWLAAGEANNTASIGAAQYSDSGLLGFFGTAVAGLVAGFNPCALSMLLFFLALLLPMGERAKSAAIAFLVAKLATYLLIGLLLVRVFQQFNPSWLPMAAKLLLTVVGTILIVMNLMDAYHAQKSEYGRIKNQLPKGMRGFLHSTIKRIIADGAGKKLVISAIALGAIVAASEFLCSGQLYLATLTTGLQRGESYFRMAMLLVVFCVMFLLPSVVITFLLLRGKQSMALSGWMLEKMPMIKLFTAIAMLLIIVFAWLV